MKKYVEVNTPAIYRKLRSDGVLKRSYTGGYPYLSNGVLMQSSIARPIYSYGKNFKRFGKEFSLFMWTNERNQDSVEDHFSKVAKSLRRDQIMSVLNNTNGFLYVEPRYY